MMTDQPTLILYDARTKVGTYSLFVFRIRMALNYKKLNFKTEWVPFSKIREVYEKVGIPPTPHRNSSENPYYTVPALIDTSVDPPVIISQSFNIEKYLDEKFPENPLWSVSPPNANADNAEKKLAFLNEVAQYLQGGKDPRFRILFTLTAPKVPNILLDIDVPYFKETRSRWSGKPFEEIGPKDTQEAMNALKEPFDDFAQFLDSWREKPFDPNDPLDTPWVLGDVVSWADFSLAGLFKGVEVSNPPMWDQMKTWNNGRWLRIVEETAQWR